MMTVYLKLGDLASWLVLSPLRELLERTGVEVRFEPVVESMGNVVSTNLRAGEDDPLAAYKARRARARNHASNRELERQCEMLGISTDGANREVHPMLLSLGLRWVASQDQLSVMDYAESVFDYLYRQQGDDQDAEGIEALVASAGVSVEGFREYLVSERPALQAEQDQLIDSGILGAPTFVVDGEIFLGREHLPLIAWQLTGRQGPPPV